jgi:hypothetical protein
MPATSAGMTVQVTEPFYLFGPYLMPVRAAIPHHVRDERTGGGRQQANADDRQ